MSKLDQALNDLLDAIHDHQLIGNAIDSLASSPDDSIEFLGASPGVDGRPIYAVLCTGHWTDFRCWRFEGATRLLALEAALEARRRIRPLAIARAHTRPYGALDGLGRRNRASHTPLTPPAAI